MRKTYWWILGIIIVAVVIVAIAHHSSNSNKPATNSTSNKGSSSQQASVNNAILTTKTNASVGQYLADPSGRTLYTYDQDKSGVSNVSGSLLTAWPAYVATSTAASLPTNVGTITRSDGTVQYTYNNMPLYFFANESSGQVTGDGVEGFHVAKPLGQTNTGTSTNNSGSSSSGSGY